MVDTLPNNQEAEESVLGAVLLSRDSVDYAVSHLQAADFYRPAHQYIFSAIETLYQTGSTIDPVTVADELDRLGLIDKIGGRPTLLTLQVSVASTGSTPRYAEIVRRDAHSRRQIHIATESIVALQGGADPYDTADSVLGQLQSLDRAGALPKGFTTYDEILDDNEADAPVIIPGMCYADSRVIVVATEKSGKSVLARMIAFCASQGVHPFTHDPIDPVRVMVWDLENPMRELRQTGHLLRYRLQRIVEDYDPSRLMIMRRPAGIDIDSRHDRNELESAIESFKPQLIIGGPVYKMLPESKMKDDRHAAAIVQNALDQIRIRHQCALILEHHAPIGQQGDRELRAIGGMMWQAWPDVSISLKSEDNFQRYVVTRPHPERGSFNWPESFTRGTKWPWEAYYPPGSDNGPF